jgi:glutamate formiminotransferase
VHALQACNTFIMNILTTVTCSAQKHDSLRSIVYLYINDFYSGEHPRMGAMDVCPFIPVRGVTMEDCIECAREFAERLALELRVPGMYLNICSCT